MQADRRNHTLSGRPARTRLVNNRNPAAFSSDLRRRRHAAEHLLAVPVQRNQRLAASDHAAVEGAAAVSIFRKEHGIPGPGGSKEKSRLTKHEVAPAICLTEQEVGCWELAGTLANRLYRLSTLHEMDWHDVVHAIHIIQNKLLARPAYQKYL